MNNRSIFGLAAGTLLIFLFFLLPGCRREVKKIKESRALMGTVVSVEIAGISNSAAAALRAAWAEAERLEKTLSRYQPGSEIDRINAEAFGHAVPVSEEMAQALGIALGLSRETGGAFDVTVGPLMRAWGFFPQRAGRVPPEAELGKVRERVGWQRLKFDPLDGTVRFLRPEMEIDLGGVAKGLIVDKMVEVLRRQGVSSALVNAGGDIYCLGEGPHGGKWRIGVEHPRREGELVTVLELRDRAVATSGDYQNYFIRSRKRYSHIMDPRTGRPARTGVVEASVVAPDCASADGLATAVFVLGAENGLSLLRTLPGVEGMIVSEEGEEIRVETTPGIRELSSVPISVKDPEPPCWSRGGFWEAAGLKGIPPGLKVMASALSVVLLTFLAAGTVLNLRALRRRRWTLDPPDEAPEVPWDVAGVVRVTAGVLIMIILFSLLETSALKALGVPTEPRSPGMLLFNVAVQYAVVIILLGAFLRRGGYSWREMRLRCPRPAVCFRQALEGYVCFFPFLVLLVALTYVISGLVGLKFKPPPLVERLLQTTDPVALGALFLIGVGLGPLLEEVFFRGFLYPALKKKIPIGGAILASAGLFSLLHFNWMGFLPVAGLGILLAYSYERTGRLLVPVFIHALHNGLFLIYAYVLVRIGEVVK